MKRIWFSIFTILITAFLISCDDLELTPEFRESSVQFAATPSTTTVAVSAADSLASVLSFTWNDPAYAVGLSNSKFRVIVGADDANFNTFQHKDFTAVLTGSLLGKEVNAMALKLGASIGQPFVLNVKVVASQENNNETKESAVLEITVTPYGDLLLTQSVNSVAPSASTPDVVGVTFNWSTAFVGYDGVKTYELQYAESGTAFADYTAVSVTSQSKSFTQFELNGIALALGITSGEEGNVDFRVKATNETGAFTYSNTATLGITPYVAFISLGIIGDATPGGWDIDTDMRRPEANQPAQWTVTLYLEGGKSAKFRANDGWTDAWGATSFPSGTASSAPGSPNVPISTSGYYKVDFNAGSGVYSFTLLTTPTYATIGIIGSATANGWNDPDTDLTNDPSNAHLWTGTITLTEGFVKFRANNAWDVSWGGTTFPSGHATPNPDIAVTAGTYSVRFNDATGEYQFMPAATAQPYTSIGIIGDSTPGGWADDTDLIQNPSNHYLWSKTVILTTGEAKFRANNEWTVSWGGSTFPNGISTTDNGPNIPVTPGTYFVTLNTGTGQYTFLK